MYTELSMRKVAELEAQLTQSVPDGEIVAATGSLNDTAVIKWISDYRATVGDFVYVGKQPPANAVQDGSDG